MAVATDLKVKWKKLKYHPVQAELLRYSGRFAAVVAGRRSGKTELCKRKLVMQLAVKKEWPDPLYFYILPTQAQAKKVALDQNSIMTMIPKNWLLPKSDGFNKTDLKITTIFGSKLIIAGADKPHRLEGVGADGIIVDESCDQKPGLWGRTLMPMLADRQGFAYRIGVPKRYGIGRQEFKAFYDRGMRGYEEEGTQIKAFFWKSEDILSPEEILIQKEELDPIDYSEQFEAQWQDIGSSVYYGFHDSNINDFVHYDPVYPIVVGCDFNVDPMCWTLSHHKNGKFYVFDEVFLRNTNTPKTLDYLFERYGHNHTAGWEFYGDATSKARKTSASSTDYLIIKNDARFGQKKVIFPQKNPGIQNRFAAVNAVFKNALGDVRFYIHPRCKHLINDFNSVSYIEGTTELEDYSGTDIGHMSDAMGYVVYIKSPIRYASPVAPQVITMAG